MTSPSDSPESTVPFPDTVSESATLELLARFRDGDSAAFGELYRRYHDELLFAVRAHLGSRLRSVLESEDVLQSVVVDAFKALPRFEPRGPGSLRHYLHQMIVNKIRARADYFNAAKRAGTEPLSESRAADLAGVGGELGYRDGDRFVKLEGALRKLPEEMRRVIVLRKVDGLPSREVATMLGKGDAAVRKLYSRALARLTAELTSSEAGG